MSKKCRFYEYFIKPALFLYAKLTYANSTKNTAFFLLVEFIQRNNFNFVKYKTNIFVGNMLLYRYQVRLVWVFACKHPLDRKTIK